MQRMSSGLAIVVSGVLTALMAALGLFCAPFGINDPQSSVGFFILALLFFIQTLLCSFAIRFDGAKERTLPSYLAYGINKLSAVAALIAFAAPHPHFTGVMLWLGVSILILSSGAKDLCHVGYSVWKDVRNWWVSRTQVVDPFHIGAGPDALFQGQDFAAEMRQQELNRKAEEESLLADLAGFLADTDSTGNGNKK